MLLAIILTLQLLLIPSVAVNETKHPIDWNKHAVVTLLMDTSSGFLSGVLALGQSLVDVDSKLQRVVMVTPDVSHEERLVLRNIWDLVVEVDIINCIFKTNPVADSMFDMKGDKWQGTMIKWAPTCTKLAVWQLIKFERVIFMDSDMIAVGNIDDALFEYSDAEFLAAPEVLPPDTINSGFMVLNPSLETFQNLLDINEDMGVAWTGDQYIINHGLCPKWHVGGKGNKCGRLPWIFNVQVLNYNAFSTVQAITGKDQPRVIHFISEGKPWQVLASEMQGSTSTFEYLESNQIFIAHALWRRCYYKIYSKINPKDQSLNYIKNYIEEKLYLSQLPGYIKLQNIVTTPKIYDMKNNLKFGKEENVKKMIKNNKNNKKRMLKKIKNKKKGKKQKLNNFNKKP